jgi:hypothetical protein
MHRHLRVVAAVALVGAAGCGGSYPLAPVSGRVTMDGQPLANAAVTFQPVPTEKGINPGPGSGGFTDADGRYTLKLVSDGSRGAVIGKHIVRITPVPKDGDATEDQQPIEPPMKAKRPPPKSARKDTKLEFDVPPGGTSAADFALTSK